MARVLVRAWPKLSPRLREQATELCVARTETADVLLYAVQERIVSPTEISIAAQNRLLLSPSPENRKAAEGLWRKRDPNRAKLIAQYRKALQDTGNMERGAQMFDRICASCHALKGRGSAVGPDLATLRDKSAEDFLVAILDPNAAIEPRFISYNVETKDGRSLSGVFRSETATSVELVAPGIHETLLRSDIASITASSLSLMPEGLEQGITPAQMNDLIAFLKAAPSAASASR